MGARRRSWRASWGTFLGSESREGGGGALRPSHAHARRAPCSPPQLTHFPPPTTRSAFDGSGADDFFSAGSCIDGRLTSAWEWCSKIDKKAYAPVFKLCSVLGFDGRWEGK